MEHGGPIRVVVVDDSAVVRKTLRAILSSDPGITVVGEGENGLEAIAKVATLAPDLVTMDIEMPVLGGLEAIERILAQQPTRILVVTSQAGVRTAFAAVSRGALDVLEKRELSFGGGERLIKKIKLLANVDMRKHLAGMAIRTGVAPKGERPALVRAPEPPDAQGRRGPVIVAIAASTGGPQALSAILPGLPAQFELPIVISQHMASGFMKGMVEWLNNGTALTVVEARHGELLRPGTVYFSPSESSMRVTPQAAILLEESPQGQLYHPSCDFMLRTVAESFRSRTLAVILSGMGNDGVSGMRAVKETGGATLAQDEGSSVVFGMNRLAIEAKLIDEVLPANAIAAQLVQIIGGRKR